MSSFHGKAIHPDTGEIKEVVVMDDFYGKHQYGVLFPGNEVFPASLVTRVITEQASVNPLQSCCWLHEGPACSCHVGNRFFCTECGHEVDCHETVRVQL